MVFNVTFNNISVISCRHVLLVEETGVPEKTTDLSRVLIHLPMLLRGPSYGSWINNYLCNQWLSPLMCTRYNIIWKSLSVSWVKIHIDAIWSRVRFEVITSNVLRSPPWLGWSLWNICVTTLYENVCQWVVTGRWFSPVLRFPPPIKRAYTI
jgi:hypothetical protein